MRKLDVEDTYGPQAVTFVVGTVRKDTSRRRTGEKEHCGQEQTKRNLPWEADDRSIQHRWHCNSGKRDGLHDRLAKVLLIAGTIDFTMLQHSIYAWQDSPPYLLSITVPIPAILSPAFFLVSPLTVH